MQPLSPQLPATNENNVLTKRKGVASTLRIQAPAQFPQIALAFCDSNPSTLSSADSDFPPFARTAAQRSAMKNMKKLSLNLPSAQSSVLSLSSADTAPTTSIVRPRRPSIASLPAISVFHRRDEDTGSPVPYADGPVQVIPGVWIGSEDNARDWKGLLERRIRSILNVAKEVLSPFDAFPASQALRSAISTPDFKSHVESDPTYYPAHVASGRPGMHYLKLDWSHGQQDLVNHGFKDGMSFVDAALDRGEGCLIHCQCGISRSATMVIALVMRAAFERHSSVPPDIWALQGMQAAYNYVKEKSPCVGPNMSLIYQLLEYEKIMKRTNGQSPRDSDTSSIAENEEEWTRRRRLLDEAPDHEQSDRESIIVMQEAEALDKAMEVRMVARKSSGSSMSSFGSSSGTGMGSAWRTRYGRKRTHSTTSSRTNGSISEDLVEEEEEEELLGIGGDFENDSHHTEEDSSSSSPDDESKGTPRNPSYLSIRLPPTAAPWKTSFGCPSPVTAVSATFDAPPPRPSPRPKVKRRPVSLSILPPVLASPINLATETDDVDPKGFKRIARPMRRQSESLVSHTESYRQEVILTKGISTSQSTDSVSTAAGTPSQTLFVFPPSPTLTNTRTPSTMTLLSNPSIPHPFSMQTPRVSAFNIKGKRRSFIGLTSPPTPTVGLAKVDARGYVGFEVS